MSDMTLCLATKTISQSFLQMTPPYCHQSTTSSHISKCSKNKGTSCAQRAYHHAHGTTNHSMQPHKNTPSSTIFSGTLLADPGTENRSTHCGKHTDVSPRKLECRKSQNSPGLLNSTIGCNTSVGASYLNHCSLLQPALCTNIFSARVTAFNAMKMI